MANDVNRPSIGLFSRGGNAAGVANTHEYALNLMSYIISYTDESCMRERDLYVLCKRTLYCCLGRQLA